MRSLTKTELVQEIRKLMQLKILMILISIEEKLVCSSTFFFSVPQIIINKNIVLKLTQNIHKNKIGYMLRMHYQSNIEISKKRLYR